MTLLEYLDNICVLQMGFVKSVCSSKLLIIVLHVCVPASARELKGEGFQRWSPRDNPVLFFSSKFKRKFSGKFQYKL